MMDEMKQWLCLFFCLWCFFCSEVQNIFVVAKGEGTFLSSSKSNKNVFSCDSKQYPKQGQISPLIIPEKIASLEWTGKPEENSGSAPNVFALTLNDNGYPGGKPWRSNSEGKADSWRDITDDLRQAIPPDSRKDAEVGVVAVHQSRADENYVFLQGSGKWHWGSTDGGLHFEAISSPGQIAGIRHVLKLHPRQASWILMRTERDICKSDRWSMECSFDLFVTRDFGKNWKNLTSHCHGNFDGIKDFDWGASISKFFGRSTKDEDIFVTAYPGDAAKKGLEPGWDARLQFLFSDDLFSSSPKMTVQCGNIFEIISDKLFLAIPSDCPVGPDGKPRKAGKGTIAGRSVTMYVSSDGSDFVEACLPADLEDDGYNLIHTHDRYGAFVLADHAEPGSRGPSLDSPTADAYAPAYNASLHTLSLEQVYRRSYIPDFGRIEGVPGYYYANQVDKEISQLGNYYLRSKISFNGGSEWNLIEPPKSFNFEKCNTCSPDASLQDCSLHLHGPTSWMAPEGPHPNLYSIESAPAILLATGNVGSHLDFHPDADCTYMSQDGGNTWQDIAENTSIYELSNAGGTIVYASHRSEGPTNQLFFSLDYGQCFHQVKLSEPMLIENIRIAPKGQSNVFLVLGTSCIKSSMHPDCTFTGGSKPNGIMYSINLPDILGEDWRECNADDQSQDYQVWDFGGRCIMGSKRTLRRRAPGTFCADPLTWKLEIKESNHCDCSFNDIECEFGFKRSSNTTCSQISGLSIGEACPRLVDSSYITSKSNMRLVHGNICTNVNKIIPDTNGKGGSKGSSDPGDDGSKKRTGSAGFVKSLFLLILILGALSVAGGLTWVHCLSADQKQIILEKISPILRSLEAIFELCLGAIVEAYDWVRLKLRKLPFFSQKEDADARGYYEALSGSGGLELDPEDQGSPNLY